MVSHLAPQLRMYIRFASVSFTSRGDIFRSDEQHSKHPSADGYCRYLGQTSPVTYRTEYALLEMFRGVQRNANRHGKYFQRNSGMAL